MVLNLKSLFHNFGGTWSEDQIYDRCIQKVFHKNQDGGKSIMATTTQGTLTSAWPKDSNDTLFVKIG
jgi:hypothetical protein